MAETRGRASPIAACRSTAEARSPLRMFGVVCTIGVCAALAGCSSANMTTTSRSKAVAQVDPKLGVAPSPRVVAAGKPVPKGGGVFQKGGKGYKVGARTYTPTPVEPKNYTATGLASYYAGEFHGRRTANGEVFDQAALSAAHPTLPLPSYVRVTNLANSRSIIVRVNDRGPFHRGRLIDVSKRTADVLGFRTAGVGRVKVDYVGLASLQGSDDRKLMATYQENGQDGRLSAASQFASLFEPQPTPAPPAPRAQPALVQAAPAPTLSAAVEAAPALRPSLAQSQAVPAPHAVPMPAARIAAAPIPAPAPIRAAAVRPAAAYAGAPAPEPALVAAQPPALLPTELAVAAEPQIASSGTGGANSAGARQRVLLSWGGLATPMPLAAAPGEALPPTATALSSGY